MRGRRLLRETGVVLLVIVCLPIGAVFVGLLILFFLPVILGAALFDWTVRAWNNLPRNRLAIERARQALAVRLPGRQPRHWHVVRRDRRKCFVRATLTLLTNPKTFWLCAVWDESGEVDELGVWQFHDGIGVRHAARAYERSRAAGRPWPTEMGQLVESVPPAELPSEAKPGERPHHGSVLVRWPDGFAFYAFASSLAEELASENLKDAEVYDAECRRLRLRTQPVSVLAPFPLAPPDKVFVVRLRHYLISRADEETRIRLRQMLPAELADYGIRTYDDSAATEETD